MTSAQRWTLAQRPAGVPAASDFALVAEPVETPGDGQILIGVSHISVDPGMRSRLSQDSYAPALQTGETIESAGVGAVLASRHPKFKGGDIVTGGFGWRTHLLSDGRGVMTLDPALFSGVVTPTAAIGVLGVPGLTAYFGLIDVGGAKAHQTLLVSSGAGPVGATAGQIGRILGMHVIGISTHTEKCGYMLSELGFDKAIRDARGSHLELSIRDAAPQGVDVYFDNVGGRTLDAAILNMKPHGRIVVSGQVSEYNRAEPRGIRHVSPFITKRLRMEGLVVYDFRARFAEAQAQLAQWIQDGRLSYREEIIDGFENAPAAFIGLFTGENFGRRLVRIA